MQHQKLSLMRFIKRGCHGTALKPCWWMHSILANTLSLFQHTVRLLHCHCSGRDAMRTQSIGLASNWAPHHQIGQKLMKNGQFENCLQTKMACIPLEAFYYQAPLVQCLSQLHPSAGLASVVSLMTNSVWSMFFLFSEWGVTIVHRSSSCLEIWWKDWSLSLLL